MRALQRGLAQLGQFGQGLRCQVADLLAGDLGQLLPGFGIGAAVRAPRQRAPQRHPVGGPADAQHRGRVGFRHVRHQPQQQRRARPSPDPSQRLESRRPLRLLEVPAQLRGAQQDRPEAPRPFAEGGARGNGAEPCHGLGQRVHPGPGIASLQVREHQPAPLHPAQERGQGRGGRGGVVHGARGHRMDIIGPGIIATGAGLRTA